LYKKGGFFRVQARGQVFAENGFNPGMEINRFGVGCQGMQIGNKKIAFCLMLQLDKIPEGPKIITQVQVACGTYAAQNSFHIRRDSKFNPQS